LAIVAAGRDLPLEGLLVCAAEVLERLWARGSNPGVTVLVGDDLLGALGLDTRQRELLAEDFGQLVQADVDLDQMIARPISRLTGPARLIFAGLAERIAHVAVALPDAALLLSTVLEARNVHGWQWNG